MKSLFLLFVGLIVLISFPASLYGATIHVQPADLTIKTGTTFVMEIKVNTQQDPLSGVDAYLIFDPTYFDIVPDSVTFAPLFTKKQAHISSETLILTAFNEDPEIMIPFTDTFARIPITAKKTGKTSISLFCDKTQDRSTKVFKKDKNFSNILDCSDPGSNQRVDVIIDDQDVLGAQISQPIPQTNNTYSLQFIALVTALITGLALIGISVKRQKN